MGRQCLYHPAPHWSVQDLSLYTRRIYCTKRRQYGSYLFVYMYVYVQCIDLIQISRMRCTTHNVCILNATLWVLQTSVVFDKAVVECRTRRTLWNFSCSCSPIHTRSRVDCELHTGVAYASCNQNKLFMNHPPSTCFPYAQRCMTRLLWCSGLDLISSTSVKLIARMCTAPTDVWKDRKKYIINVRQCMFIRMLHISIFCTRWCKAATLERRRCICVNTIRTRPTVCKI